MAGTPIASSASPGQPLPGYDTSAGWGARPDAVTAAPGGELYWASISDHPGTILFGRVTPAGVDMSFYESPITEHDSTNIDTDPGQMVGYDTTAPYDGFAPTGIARQSDGKFVVVGTHTSAGTGATAVGVVRILPNGDLDRTFDGDGKATFPVPSGTTVTTGRVAIGATGRIVLTAAERTPSGAVMAVYALGVGGKLDKTFGTQGRAAVLGGPGMTIAGDGSGSVTDGSFVPVTLIANGKILTGAGVCDALPTSTTGSCTVSVLRLTGKGVPDPTFSGDGRADVSVPVSPAAFSAYDIHALTGGHVLVFTGNESTELLARIRPDGTPNPTFGTAGVKTLPGIGLPIASAVQPDGKVLTMSRAEYLFQGEVVAPYSLVRRWTWNGTRDANFGSPNQVSPTWVPRYGVAPGKGAAMASTPHGLVIGTDNSLTGAGGGYAWEDSGLLFWFDRYAL